MTAAFLSAMLLAVVGPGPVGVALPAGHYRIGFHLTPNLASQTGRVSVSLREGGRPVAGARVRMTVTMLDMNMGGFTVQLPERAAGTYTRMFPVVGMSGRWGFRLDVRPAHGRAFSVALADRMLG
jgi:hypothetical protein